MTGRASFTLVELLAVIAVVAIAASLGLPALAAARNRALQGRCLSNLHQLYGGFILYAGDHGGFYPAVFDPVNNAGAWVNATFPYLYPSRTVLSDNANLWNTVYVDAAALSDRHRRGLSAANPTLCGYGMNQQLPAQGGGNASTSAKSPAATAAPRTALLMDNDNGVAGGTVRYTYISSVSGRHGGPINVLYCDGHAESTPLASIPQSQTNVFWSGLAP